MIALAVIIGALIGVAIQQALYRIERQRFLRAIQAAVENFKNGGK